MTPELAELLARVHERIGSRVLTIHSTLYEHDPHPWLFTVVWVRTYHYADGRRVTASEQRTAGATTLEDALREVLAVEDRLDAGLREALAQEKS